MQADLENGTCVNTMKQNFSIQGASILKFYLSNDSKEAS